jgi:hypothetical protein
MTDEEVIQRVAKLRAVTVQRGASPHEAATAAAIAARLSARLGRDRPVAATAAPAPGDRRSPRSLRFVAFA